MRRVIIVGALLTLGSFVLAEIGASAKPERNFFISLTRFWELFAGSGVAIVMLTRNVKPSQEGALAGLLMILGAMLVYDKSYHFPSV